MDDILEQQLQESINNKIDGLSPLSNWSIWRIPESLRIVNEDAYSPRIISIGPLHHGREILSSMEVHKLYYMRSLLQRTPDSRTSLNSCSKAILQFLDKVRACYTEPIEYDKGPLAEILLVDGCFILELFIRYSKVDLRVQDDPLFYTSWINVTLQRDLALLENQIPFFVLELLYSEAVQSSSTIGPSLPNLTELAISFFRPLLYMNDETSFRFNRRPFTHLLDLIHNCYSPSPAARDIRRTWSWVEPITTLYDAEIEIRRETSTSLFDLKFEHGVLKIPPLCINDTTVSLFQNLIAYEQLSRGNVQYVTSYFLIMAHLVDSMRDAELLVRKGVIENDTGGWKDVSLLFNDICKQVVVRDFYYAGLCDSVNSHYKTRWALYKATLRKDYFGNPWAATSVVAATLLLCLAAIQAIYTALSYYDHPN